MSRPHRVCQLRRRPLRVKWQRHAIQGLRNSRHGEMAVNKIAGFVCRHDADRTRLHWRHLNISLHVSDKQGCSFPGIWLLAAVLIPSSACGRKRSTTCSSSGNERLLCNVQHRSVAESVLWLNGSQGRAVAECRQQVRRAWRSLPPAEDKTDTGWAYGGSLMLIGRPAVNCQHARMQFGWIPTGSPSSGRLGTG